MPLLKRAYSPAPLVAEFNALFQPVFEAPSSNGLPYTPAVASRTNQAGELHWHIDPLWGDYGTTERRDSRLQVQREQAAHIVHTIHALRSEASEKPLTFAVLVRAREHAAPITRLRCRYAGESDGRRERDCHDILHLISPKMLTTSKRSRWV